MEIDATIAVIVTAFTLLSFATLLILRFRAKHRKDFTAEALREMHYDASNIPPFASSNKCNSS